MLEVDHTIIKKWKYPSFLFSLLNNEVTLQKIPWAGSPLGLKDSSCKLIQQTFCGGIGWMLRMSRLSYWHLDLAERQTKKKENNIFIFSILIAITEKYTKCFEKIEEWPEHYILNLTSLGVCFLASGCQYNSEASSFKTLLRREPRAPGGSQNNALTSKHNKH